MQAVTSNSFSSRMAACTFASQPRPVPVTSPLPPPVGQQHLISKPVLVHGGGGDDSLLLLAPHQPLMGTVAVHYNGEPLRPIHQLQPLLPHVRP